ncbi:SusC/RagA family TonB-linked outer membrane protein [Compostibacter hankyongensis]
MRKAILFIAVFQVFKIEVNARVIILSQMKAPVMASANTQELMERTVSLNMDRRELKEIFRQLEHQLDVSFLFSSEIMPGKVVSVTVHNEPLGKVLDKILKPLHITYLRKGARILLIKEGAPPPVKAPLPGGDAAPPSKPADTLISGTVRASGGELLTGVTVRVKGKSSGAITGTGGEFSLHAGPHDSLVASYIGYRERTLAIGGRSTVNIVLDEAGGNLSEIVVIGYGSQANKDVTGSIGTISMKNVQHQAVTSPDQLLTGQISGVQITQPAGIPGGGPTIQVRGIGAIGAGSQPLYVVDGFPLPRSSTVVSNPLNNIMPEDIASISVLKDASATAIYGSRGANGVVIIETKKGKSGKLQTQISAYRGVQKVPGKGRPDLMNAREFAQWRKDAISSQIRYEQGREPVPDDIPVEYRNPGQYGEGTDWIDAIERVAPMQELRFSISGGSDRIRSYISGGYTQQDGVIIGTDYKRFSFRANVDGHINNKIEAGLNLAPTFSIQHLSSIGGNGRNEPGFGYALSASPIAAIYNEDGSYVPMVNSTGTFSFANPVMVLKELKNESQKFEGIMNGFVQYKPLPVLTLRSAINLSYSSDRTKTFHPSYIGGTNQAPPVIPTGTFNAPSFTNYDLENTVAYQNTFDHMHSVDAMAGYTFQKNNVSSAAFNGTDYPSDDIETLNAAATITGATTEEEWSLVSYFARINYAYKDKYLLTATFRRDGSSRFGRESQWGNFPSASLGWRVSEEPFMNSVRWISNLKLRASYGVTGNFNIGNYAYSSHIGTSDYVFGGSRAPGQVITSLGNPSLMWERSREINIGVNAGLWNDRILLNADVYKRNTVDMLLDDEVPESSGFSTVTVNRGNIVNKGIELGITSVNLGRESKVSWTTNLTFTVNRNKVLELGNSGAPIYSGFGGGGEASNITMIGQPVGMFFGWKLTGLYKDEADIKNSPAYPTVVPGDLKFADVNGDGKLTEFDDFTIIGNPYPDFIYGLTNTLSYRNFSLRVLMSGSYGGSMYREDHHYYHNTDGVFNVTRDQLNAWKSPEDPGDGIVPNNAGSESRRFYRMVNSGAIENNSYLWIKNITLGYDLPKLGKNRNNLHLYLSIQNAFLFSKYRGSNPEGGNYNASSGDGVLAPGLDFVSYPVPRIITFGVEFNM